MDRETIDLQSAPLEDHMAYRITLIRASSHLESQKAVWIDETIDEFKAALHKENLRNATHA